MIKIDNNGKRTVINYQDDFYSKKVVIFLVYAVIFLSVTQFVTIDFNPSSLNIPIFFIVVILGSFAIFFFNKRSWENISEHVELHKIYMKEVNWMLIAIFFLSLYSITDNTIPNTIPNDYPFGIITISLFYLILTLKSIVNKSFIDIKLILSDSEINILSSVKFLGGSKKWEKNYLKENSFEFILVRTNTPLVYIKPEDMKYDDIQSFLNNSGKYKINHYLIFVDTNENDRDKKYQFTCSINNREDLKLISNSFKSINLPINVLKIN